MLDQIQITHPDLLQYMGRTKGLLASGTVEPVRILVYGQSISKQAWWLHVKQALKERYPKINLDMRNTAIGGFHSTRLLRTVEQDVRTFYPDLIIFHDYGPEEDYEAIIRIIRNHTTAEIAIQTDHYVATQNDEFHDAHCDSWLPQLCEKYHLALIDVRANWKRYLEQAGVEAQSLLRDNVHLNEVGNRLMSEIVMGYWDAAPESSPDAAVLVNTYTAGVDFDVDTAELNFAFIGNRVDVISEGGGKSQAVDVRVDGTAPTALHESLVVESPWIRRDESRPYRVGVPLRITLTEKAEMDIWYLDITKVQDNGREVAFNVISSLHGFQGKGVSSKTYTSRNGAIRITPENWFVRETPEFYHMLASVDVGDCVHWNVTAPGTDRMMLPQAQPVMVFQGGSSAYHHLHLHAVGGGKLPIKALRVYAPSLPREEQ